MQTWKVSPVWKVAGPDDLPDVGIGSGSTDISDETDIASGSRAGSRGPATGPGPDDQKKLDRALELSRDKYCSFTHSLRTDIEIDARGAPVWTEMPESSDG